MQVFGYCSVGCFGQPTLFLQKRTAGNRDENSLFVIRKRALPLKILSKRYSTLS